MAKFKTVKFKVVHPYNTQKGEELTHHWYTDNPDAYVAEVKKKAPHAKLIGIYQV